MGHYIKQIRKERARSEVIEMTDCEITMNDLLNAQLNARIEGIKSERARIVGIIEKHPCWDEFTKKELLKEIESKK